MATKYPHSFTPLNIGKVQIRNRYALAPMGTGSMGGPKGEYTDNTIEYYLERARGGFGLIVMGSIIVDMEAQKPDLINGPIPPAYAPSVWRESACRLVERIHAYGTKVFMQLGFGHGRQKPGQKAPSPIPRYADPSEICEPITVEEIHTKIRYMVKTAKMAKDAGFDGVEVHAMHWGYLLDQFAMALCNFREDEYGGSLENRLRVHKEIVEGIKAECGQDFPVSIRMGMKSYIKGFHKPSLFGDEEAGRTIEEACEIAKLLESYGYDMLDCNSGIYDSFYYAVAPAYMDKGYNIKLAKEIKKHVSIPVFVAGKMNDPELCEQAIANGEIDGVALGRAGLADGAYPQKLMRGRPDKIHPCIACGNCMASSFSKVSATCAVNPIGMRPGQYPLTRAVQPKKVLVVGGGVGGMEAARIAATRGHSVTLAERSDRLGGRLFDAGVHKFKEDIRNLAKWYDQELKDLGVTVQLGTEMTSEDIRASGADAVIFSIGADPVMPRSIPGIDHPKAVSCTDVLSGKRTVGQKVAIIGAGLVGAEMAYDMAKEEGKEIVLVDGLDDILSNDPDGVPFQTRWMLNELLDLHGVRKYMGHMLAGINDQGCVLKSKSGELVPIEADDVIIAIGFRSRKSMYEALYGTDMEVYEIVAGNGIGSIANQVNAAYEITRNL
ncbi:MAG: FAD-dependent oxidoreductase [Oscillospiraceae bacterium]|nr:FAD-dependent oxidoreductase [Oscillospiraceae bacterium]